MLIMKIKCIIVDDEPAASRIIESFLANFKNFEIVANCKTAFEAAEILNHNQVDLIFLDINMPGLSGIDFLKSIKNPPIVIITTAYRDYAVESFELEVLDYLHKPISMERFYKSIQRVQEYLKRENSLLEKVHNPNESNFIFIHADKKHYKINLDTLLYIESVGDYCKFITNEQAIISYSTLKNLEVELPSHFLRVHKSFIVHFDKIDVIEGNTIRIEKYEIPIGYSYRNKIQKLIKK